MKKVLAFAATSEAAMGLVSLVYPPIAVRQLFGSEIAGAGVVMGRIADISLVALGLACWPGSDGDSGLAQALRGMLCYRSARHTFPRISRHRWRACRQLVVAGGGAPRHTDVPSGRRLAQRSAD